MQARQKQQERAASILDYGQRHTPASGKEGNFLKIRFIEPSNAPYKRAIQNLYVYDKYIRTPSQGALTLSTIVKKQVEDTKMYSESISKIIWEDVLDSDIIFFSIFTFSAKRGYGLAEYIKANSNAVIVFGGLHATLHYEETCRYCDYVLLGEGDETILKFVEAVANHLPIDFAGVAYYQNGKLVYTGTPSLPQNID